MIRKPSFVFEDDAKKSYKPIYVRAPGLLGREMPMNKPDNNKCKYK